MFLDHPAVAPIRALMIDPHITEIMINGPDEVFVERDGVMQLAGVQFKGVEALQAMIDLILRPSRRTVSSKMPYTDFRLPDGSRGNVIIHPLALKGPVVTIRKLTRNLMSPADLVLARSLSEEMARLLAVAVKARANILFSGAAGTGKTTAVNIFSRYIPESERIITIEDTIELQFQQRHVVQLEARRPNLEGKGEVTLSDLFRNALRMRPTRIIVGEVRGPEAVDMIQAISSGHEGCMAVVHASSPLDAISRLEMMSLSRGLMLPLWAIHKQIAAAIDLIVQLEQRPDGSRRITRLTDVSGVENDEIILRDLYQYQRTGVDSHGYEIGDWIRSNIRPRFWDKVEDRGVTVPKDLHGRDH